MARSFGQYIERHAGRRHRFETAGQLSPGGLFHVKVSVSGSDLDRRGHVEFLKALRAQFKRKLMIVWDGAAQHKSRIVREYLDSTNGEVQMALLPPYAPDLNPVEYLWAWLKRDALTNFYPRHLGRTQRHRPPQAQKRAEAKDHHHGLLDAS